jgi:hypothetical protein
LGNDYDELKKYPSNCSFSLANFSLPSLIIEQDAEVHQINLAELIYVEYRLLQLTGRAVMLDETINYVQSLQHQVEVSYLTKLVPTDLPDAHRTESHIVPYSLSEILDSGNLLLSTLCLQCWPALLPWTFGSMACADYVNEVGCS